MAKKKNHIQTTVIFILFFSSLSVSLLLSSSQHWKMYYSIEEDTFRSQPLSALVFFISLSALVFSIALNNVL